MISKTEMQTLIGREANRAIRSSVSIWMLTNLVKQT